MNVLTGCLLLPLALLSCADDETSSGHPQYYDNGNSYVRRLGAYLLPKTSENSVAPSVAYTSKTSTMAVQMTRDISGKGYLMSFNNNSHHQLSYTLDDKFNVVGYGFEEKYDGDFLKLAATVRYETNGFNIITFDGSRNSTEHTFTTSKQAYATQQPATSPTEIELLARGAASLLDFIDAIGDWKPIGDKSFNEIYSNNFVPLLNCLKSGNIQTLAEDETIGYSLSTANFEDYLELNAIKMIRYPYPRITDIRRDSTDVYKVRSEQVMELFDDDKNPIPNPDADKYLTGIAVSDTLGLASYSHILHQTALQQAESENVADCAAYGEGLYLACPFIVTKDYVNDQKAGKPVGPYSIYYGLPAVMMQYAPGEKVVAEFSITGSPHYNAYSGMNPDVKLVTRHPKWNPKLYGVNVYWQLVLRVKSGTLDGNAKDFVLFGDDSDGGENIDLSGRELGMRPYRFDLDNSSYTATCRMELLWRYKFEYSNPSSTLHFASQDGYYEMTPRPLTYTYTRKPVLEYVGQPALHEDGSISLPRLRVDGSFWFDDGTCQTYWKKDGKTFPLNPYSDYEPDLTLEDRWYYKNVPTFYNNRFEYERVKATINGTEVHGTNRIRYTWDKDEDDRGMSFVWYISKVSLVQD